MTQPNVPNKLALGRDDQGVIVYSALQDSGQVDGQGNHLFYLPGGATDPQSAAQRVTPRPTDVGALGSYIVAALSGTMAAGLTAASPVFMFRSKTAAGTSQVLIKRVSVAMTSLGVGFTAGVGLFSLVVARSFTAPDTGGTALTLTGNNGKLRTSFATITDAAIIIASTAALTPGTRTLDGTFLAQQIFGVTTATNAAMLTTTDLLRPATDAGNWPLVLAHDEGFEIQATVPATGTWQFQVGVEWIEVASY